MHHPATIVEDLKHAARGLLMGAADIIPGVSGGTVALVVGIYERLVTAISHFDLQLVAAVAARDWHRAAAHVDLRFLIALGLGIVTGILSLASLMNYLLVHHPEPTSAVFFGLILASCVLVARMIEQRSVPIWALGILGTAFSFILVGQLPATAPEGLLYVFVCGVVAICAMILPGISGAFILLLMGKYGDITADLRNTIHFQNLSSTLPTLIVFVTGCAVGLIGFSKFLRWLLARHEAQTTAILCGFMLGSLRKIWPFKVDLNPDVLDVKHKAYRNVLPDFSSGEVWLAIGLAVVAFIFVLLLDYVSKGRAHEPPLEPVDHLTVAEEG